MLTLKFKKIKKITCKNSYLNIYRDTLWTQLKLDKLKFSDSVSEKESFKSIQNDTNDIFLEI